MNTDLRVRNHQIPRCLLKHWSTKKENKKGIYYFDFEKQEIIFSPGEAASFAIVNFLYVPKLPNSQRDDSLEVDFSKGESDLARLIDATIKSRQDKISIDTAQKVIRTCIALAYRSGYYSARAALSLTKGNETDSKLHLDVIEITRKTISRRQKELENWSYCIIKNLDNDLFINETPFIDNPMQKNGQNIVFMPLHPRILMVGVPSLDGKFHIRWDDAKNGNVNVNEYNKWAVETARCFLVSKTESQLHCMKDQLSRNKILERMGKDKVFSSGRLNIYLSIKRFKPFLMSTTRLIS